MAEPNSSESDDGEDVHESIAGDEGGSYDLEPTPADDVPFEALDEDCDRCGAPIPEDPSLQPCPSCGLDRDSGEVVDPERVAVDSASEVDAGDTSISPPLLAPGRPVPWLIAAGVVALVVAFAMLAGWSSFYPSEEGRFLDASGDAVLDAPLVTLRLIAVAKYLVGSLVLVGAGIVAVRITCWLEQLETGDLRTGVARLGLLVATASLARLIGFEIAFLQSLTQLVLGAVVVTGGTILVFGRRDRTVGMFLLAWVLVVLLVIPVTRIVSWSLPLW